MIAYFDSNGQPAAHFQYGPFGNPTVDEYSNAADFPYRFSTKPQDPITGLYYYGYRYYDPLIGRWPSRDPIGELGGSNLYGFIGNDGFNVIDFLGLWFADGRTRPSLKELNASGVIFLDGKGGYDYEVIDTLTKLMKTAAENHEKLHITQVKASNQSHAVPYKQLFCRNKKFYYYSAEKGALQRYEWTPGKDREDSKKSLLWIRDTSVRYSSASEEATNELAAHNQEINELIAGAYKQGAKLTEENGIFKVIGEKKPGVEHFGRVETRITTVLAPRSKYFSTRLNDQTQNNDWTELINAYQRERREAVAKGEDFSFPIPEIIYNEILANEN